MPQIAAMRGSGIIHTSTRVIKYGVVSQTNTQELVGVAQEVLQNTPVEAFQGDEKPQHQLKRGRPQHRCLKKKKSG